MAQNPKDEIDALKRELAEMKKRLASFEDGAASQQKNTDYDTTQPCRILDLPPELRAIIFEYCVVPGKVFISHANSVKTYDMRITPTASPEVQVFRVCKQFHAEARELFLGRNLFVLTPGPCTALPALRRFVENVDTKLVRRVSISFDFRDYAAIGVNENHARRVSNKAKATAGTPNLARKDVISFACFQMTEDIWCPMLATLVNFNNLDYLQVNLQNCLDPMGVSRVVKSTLAQSRCDHCRAKVNKAGPPSVVAGLVELEPEVLDIIGTWNKRERAWLRWKLRGILSEVQFHSGKNLAREIDEGSWDEKQELVEEGPGQK